MMDYEYIKVERDEGVVTITMNKPEWLNPLTIPMMEEMTQEIDLIRVNPDDKVLLLTGTGRGFSSGGDMKAMGQRAEGAGTARSYWNVPTMSTDERLEMRILSGHRIMKQIQTLMKPSIAAVNGVAAGAGMDIACACDIRIASEYAKFIQVYIRRGLIPVDGGCYWLPRLIGLSKAFELIYTGDELGAYEAERLGLVSKVVAHEELMPTTFALAKRLAKGPAVALGLAKHLILESLKLDFEESLDLANKGFTLAQATEDAKEGIRSFLEKRPPQFKGK